MNRELSWGEAFLGGKDAFFVQRGSPCGVDARLMSPFTLIGNIIDCMFVIAF